MDEQRYRDLTYAINAAKAQCPVNIEMPPPDDCGSGTGDDRHLAEIIDNGADGASREELIVFAIRLGRILEDGGL